MLADDAGAEAVLHRQQFLALALQHLVNRHAGPARHDGGDVFVVDDFMNKRLGVFGGFRLARRELLFKRRNVAVFEFRGAAEIAPAFGVGELLARLVERFLDLGGGSKAVFFRFPPRSKVGRFLLKLR